MSSRARVFEVFLMVSQHDKGSGGGLGGVGRARRAKTFRLLVVGCGWWYDREIFVALKPRRFSHQRLIAL